MSRSYSVTPSGPSISPASLNTCARSTPTREQVPSAGSQVQTRSRNSPYTPNSALIDALGLELDRVAAINLLSDISQSAERRGNGNKFAATSGSFQHSRAQARLHRRSRYPQPMVLSPPPSHSQPSPPRPKRLPRGAPTHPIRKLSSSSRRTSRSTMVGYQPVVLPLSNNPNAPKSKSIIYSPNNAQVFLTDSPTTDHRQSPGYVKAEKRVSKALSTTLILPPFEIHPLTFSPFLAQFSDHSSSTPSTPSLPTPSNEGTTLVLEVVENDLRNQKTQKRYARCPSTFLHLGPSSPSTPTSPATPLVVAAAAMVAAIAEKHVQSMEKQAVFPQDPARNELVLPTKVVVPSLPPFTCPPRSDSLRSGYLKTNAEKFAAGTSERSQIVHQINPLAGKAPLRRPKLTLHIPRGASPSPSTAALRPLPLTRQRIAHIRIDTAKARVLPLVPSTSQ